MNFLTTQGPAAAHSPFPLAASAQTPSATTLVDPTVTLQNGPVPPAPQPLADPVLSPNYGSAAAFFFNASRPMDLSFSAPRLLQPVLPSNLDLGGMMAAPTCYETSAPTGASGRIPLDPQPTQSPFPGMGAGVHGSSSFKHAGNLNARFDAWPAS